MDNGQMDVPRSRGNQRATSTFRLMAATYALGWRVMAS
jgi:hypothetical protein